MTTVPWTADFFTTDFYQAAYENTGIMAKFDSVKQAEQITALLEAEPGSHILDWCGGWGRISLPLLKMGYRVTLLDFSEPYVRQAIEAARKMDLPLQVVVSDFRATPRDIRADFAINVFSAGIGYFTKREDGIALEALHRALKPGARVLIDTMNFSWIARNFSECGWQESEDGNHRLLEKRKFDHRTQTITAVYTYHDKIEGGEQLRQASFRVYTPGELAEILKDARFEPTHLYGDFSGAPFGWDSKRIVMIAKWI